MRAAANFQQGAEKRDDKDRSLRDQQVRTLTNSPTLSFVGGKPAMARALTESGLPQARRYCFTSTNGSAVSGTRRHCALSSASKCQTSPLGDMNNNSPRSSRHTSGLKLTIDGSQRGFRNS